MSKTTPDHQNPPKPPKTVKDGIDETDQFKWSKEEIKEFRRQNTKSYSDVRLGCIQVVVLIILAILIIDKFF